MEKYKVCPGCGEHNNPIFIECYNCGTDLMTVNVTDKEIENIKYTTEEKEFIFKLCGCGTINPPGARKCITCDEDISDIIPIAKSESLCKNYTLVEVSGNFTYDIPQCSEIVLGRENVLKEYINDKYYVSRNHAKLILKDDKLYIINLSNTNFTYVNNEKVSSDTPTLLKANDEIGLGGYVKDGSHQDLAVYLVVREK